jgi:hypothetical protein
MEKLPDSIDDTISYFLFVYIPIAGTYIILRIAEVFLPPLPL